MSAFDSPPIRAVVNFSAATFLLTSGWIIVLACQLPPPHPVHPVKRIVVLVDCAGTDLDRGLSLREKIESAAPNTSIRLCAGTHELDGKAYEPGLSDGVWITQDGLTIYGNNPAVSIIKLQRPVYVGLAIRSGVENLTIRNLSISGSITPDEATTCCQTEPGSFYRNTHGIGSYGGTTGVHHVLIENVEVRDVAVGIHTGAEAAGGGPCTFNGYHHVTIRDNTVKNMYGTTSGSGYGIVTACTQNLLVIDNTIRNTGRHAIYHGRTVDTGASLDDVLIIRNAVIDHGTVAGVFLPTPYYRSSIVVARGNNSSIVDNESNNSQYPVSVEYDPTQPSSCADNNHLIGNKFIETVSITTPNIWLNSGTESDCSGKNHVTVWGNQLNGQSAVGGMGGPRELISSGARIDPTCFAGTTSIRFLGDAASGIENAGNLAQGYYLQAVVNKKVLKISPIFGTPPCNAAGRAWLPTS